jgi:hypothetical protein
MTRRVQSEKPEPTASAWSETPPTVPGWYWWKEKADSTRAGIVEVATQQDGSSLVLWRSFQKNTGDVLWGLWGPRIPSAEDLAALLSSAGKAVDVLKEAAANPALNYSATAAADELRKAIEACH